MTTFTAQFCTDGGYATHEIDADTLEQALEKARKIADEEPENLVFMDYDQVLPINEIGIGDVDCKEFVFWMDDDFRLRLAARDLLDAARQVLKTWEHGDLAGAVRELAAAVAKAEGGAS